jgi:hypothetical protein
VANNAALYAALARGGGCGTIKPDMFGRFSELSVSFSVRILI